MCVDDGNLQAESDSGEFWVLFGGFAPISRKVISEDEVIPEETAAKLYRYFLFLGVLGSVCRGVWWWTVVLSSVHLCCLYVIFSNLVHHLLKVSSSRIDTKKQVDKINNSTNTENEFLVRYHCRKKEISGANKNESNH